MHCPPVRWILCSAIVTALVFYVVSVWLRHSEQLRARQRAERWKDILGRDDEREEKMARMSPGARAEFLLNERGRGGQ
jgi:hypothetical protein